jgi:hypothetical protein
MGRSDAARQPERTHGTRSKKETTMSETTESEFQPFTPDPALRRLDPLVGEWKMTGNLVGSTGQRHRSCFGASPHTVQAFAVHRDPRGDPSSSRTDPTARFRRRPR